MVSISFGYFLKENTKKSDFKIFFEKLFTINSNFDIIRVGNFPNTF